MSRRRVAPAASVLVFIFLFAAVPMVHAECWRPPVDAPVADPFRRPACRWCTGNRGIEYSTAPGTPVRAVRAGVVTFAGPVAGTTYVVVEHPDGRRATYGVLARSAVRRGDVVVARSVVGVAGERFHFGLRDGRRYLDPTPYLGRLIYPVRLVPLDGSSPRPAGSPRLVCSR